MSQHLLKLGSGGFSLGNADPFTLGKGGGVAFALRVNGQIVTVNNQTVTVRPNDA